MSRRLTVITALVVLMATIASSPALADDSKFSYSGAYSAWFQSQKNFKFGAVDYNDNYAVQNLRLKLQFDANETLSAVTRFDISQGWWGVDNVRPTVKREGGANNTSEIFDFKDTNFLLHVDQAYAWMRFVDMRLHLKVGRINYSLGQKMVLDNNLDGFQISWENRWFLNYAKVSEGIDGLSDNVTIDDDGMIIDGGDAHLLMAGIQDNFKQLGWSAYGFYYTDDSWHDGTTYMPNDINYRRSRFTPNITTLWTFGLSGNLSDKEKGWTGRFEGDYLIGTDKVEKTQINAIQLSDINNGDLTGWNFLFDLKKELGKFDLGGIFGMGSGDSDVTSGKGNVNKLRTSGFFYVTEVWEDSIMPDEEGITPQGLGAPNIRGYRELENTTLFQVNGMWRFHPKFKIFASYTYLQATQPVYEWSVNDNGTPADPSDDFTDIGTENSKDIGSELDGRLHWNLQKSLSLVLRGGVFWPGEAAGYIVLGNKNWSDPAYETKLALTLKF